MSFVYARRSRGLSLDLWCDQNTLRCCGATLSLWALWPTTVVAFTFAVAIIIVIVVDISVQTIVADCGGDAVCTWRPNQ